MFTQQLAPVAGSLTASALIALLPLITIFILLGVFRIKAHWAGLASLAVAVIVAITAFKMPVGLALLSGTEGAVFGLFPIMWIVFNALWVYQLTVVSGRFEDLRESFNLISADPRIMAVLIAFCFGGLLEALAGFGAPVAITGVMLMAIGFSAFRAAAIVLLANTAPVAFGAIATPILTAATLTNIPASEIGAVVGRQTPVLALFVPLILVALVDGRRGLRQTWPAALVCGVSFALAQFVSSNFISVELTDIIASLVAVGATMAFLRVWQPSGTEEAISDLRAATAEAEDVPGAGGVTPAGRADDRSETASGPGRTGGTSGGSAVATPAASSRELTAGRIMMALVPYIIVIAVFSIAKLFGPVKTFLVGTDVKIEWPGLHGNVLSAAGKPISSTIYNFQWLSSPGSLLVLCGILTAICYRMQPGGGRAGVLHHGVQAALGVPHRGSGARPGVRDEPVRPDADDRQLDRRDGRVLRVPVASPRLARHRGHRVGHVGQRAVRHPAAGRRGAAPGSTRPCSWPPTPPAAWSAR